MKEKPRPPKDDILPQKVVCAFPIMIDNDADTDQINGILMIRTMIGDKVETKSISCFPSEIDSVELDLIEDKVAVASKTQIIKVFDLNNCTLLF